MPIKRRVGVPLQPQPTTFESFANAVQTVEAPGVDSIWNQGHFFPSYGEVDGEHYEAWATLTAGSAHKIERFRPLKG